MKERDGQIIYQINNLKQHVAKLEEELEQLTVKLYPILKIECEESGNTEREKRPHLVPLASDLLDIDNKICSLGELVTYLNQSMEL